MCKQTEKAKETKRIEQMGWLGFSLTSFLGTCLHFLYDLSGNCLATAPFSGVNESTWEHMKLLFFPMLLFAIAERRFLRGRADFWQVKLGGTLLGLILIPVLFYTYNGVIGKSPDFVNIAIFFVAAAVGYRYETRRFCQTAPTHKNSRLAAAAFCLLFALFVLFTFYPPHIGIFRDPLTGGYGIAYA